MFSLLRTGPQLIVLGTGDAQKLSDFLVEKIDGISVNFHSALKVAGENTTVVLIAKPGRKTAYLKDISKIVYFSKPAEQFLVDIINVLPAGLVTDCRTAPGIIIMRSIGDFGKIIASVRETYDGRTMTLNECLEQGSTGQTVIGFCEKPLENTIDTNDLMQECLLVNINTNELFSKLKNQSLRFLNEGIIDRQWYDIKIKIYDRYSKYKLHYDRLAIMLDNFETGIILGESWGKDYPRFLMTVLVYQIRLFTLDDPSYLKKLLMGLEYLDDGTRICDFDLINNDKKVDWTDILDKETKGMTRCEIGLKYRKQILGSLNEKDHARIQKYEDEILNTRD